MQFYKHGDAVPFNAICELDRLEEMLGELDRSVPVAAVDELLEVNVGEAREVLPSSFSLGYYLFLVLRAELDVSWPPLTSYAWRDLPEEQRPDVQLAREVGIEGANQGYPLPDYSHPVLNRVHFSIAVGQLVHTWRRHNTKLTFLQWLQRITKITARCPAGYIAGGYRQSTDISYLDLDVWAELEEREDPEEWLIEEVGECAKAIEDLGERRTSLDELRRSYDLVSGPFWGGEIPRGDYLGP